jgi:hypothetical protein
MNIYTKKITDIIKTSGRANRSMRNRFTGPQLYKAGMELLERIHKEEPSIGATQDELQEEQDIFKQLSVSEKSEKPELTMEYLKSVGLEQYCIWGNK